MGLTTQSVHQHRGRAAAAAVAVPAVIAALLAGPPSTPAIAATTGAATVSFHLGSPSLDDGLNPGYGNGGYDIWHYDIDLHYIVASKRLTGTTTIRARLTENLSRFNLDFALPVRGVTVDGATATFAQEEGDAYYGKELVVTPSAGLRSGSVMTVVVSYSAFPRQVRLHGYSGWHFTRTGVSIWNEPIEAAEWWYPGNDHPSDKATRDVTVTTARDQQVVTNGELQSHTVHGRTATWHWRSGPMATYLSQLSIGRYDVVHDTGPAGLPLYMAYERGGGVYMQRARRDVARMPEILAFLEQRFGEYPFGTGGALVTRARYGTAFEAQTRSIFTSLYWKYHPSNVWAVVHETAHQWFGDDVTASRWRHIWLAEGFATYAEWLWSGAHGNGTAQRLFNTNYHQYGKNDPFWKVAVVRPSYVLGKEVYERGAMTLQALRNVVGTPTFFAILRTWSTTYGGESATTADFGAVARQVSGMDLTRFFRVWLHATHRPAPTHRNGFPPGSIVALAKGQVHAPASYDDIRRIDAMLAQQRPSS